MYIKGSITGLMSVAMQLDSLTATEEKEEEEMNEENDYA